MLIEVTLPMYPLLQSVIEWALSIKGLWLIIFSYLAKLLWSWDKRPSPVKIVAGFLICILIYILIDEYVPAYWQNAAFFTGGLLTGRIIDFVLRLAKVNEEEIIERSKKFWNPKAKENGTTEHRNADRESTSVRKPGYKRTGTRGK